MTRLETARLLSVLTLLTLVAACGGKPSVEGVGSSPYDDPPLPVVDVDAGDPDPVDAAPPPPVDAGIHRDNGAPSTVYPAPHPEMARVLTAGGGVLKTPRVVPITFAGDPFRDTLETFAAQIGASSFWTANTAEYGVGPAISGTPIRAIDSLPLILSDDAIQNWLRGKLDGHHADWGTPDEQTIYTLFYPAGVTIDLDGYASCDLFGGYHSEVSVGALAVPYAVIPRCATFADLHGFEVLTVAASHELIEAATDPHPFTDPAFTGTDDAHAIWGLFTGGETGDMCTFNAGAFYTPPGLPFRVQRSWSNAAALAGHDPCVPSVKNEVYFNSAAILEETIDLEGRKTQGITIPVGGRGTVDLALYSDGPTSGPWHVSAHDLSEYVGGPKVLNFSFDRTSGVNGERLHMTIDVRGIDAQYAGEGFVVISELNGQKSYWYGFVAN